MNLQRITRIQVAVVWLVLAVAIAVLFFVMFIQPQKKAIQSTEEQAAAAQLEADKRPSAEQELGAAQAAEVEINSKYEKIMSNRMPKLDFSDPIASTVRMWDFQGEEQALMDRWFASTGARVSGYSFPTWGANMPGSFPDPNTQMLDPLNWNLSIEVRDFPALLDWLLKLPKAPRFMAMQSVTIAGPREAGQGLVAQVPVTLYEWTGLPPQGGGGAPAAAPAAGGGGGMGGGGRMGGGMGGGGRMGGGMGGGMGGRGRMGGGG